MTNSINNLNINICRKCRLCNSYELMDIFSLGTFAISTFTDDGLDGLITPLDLVLCKKCSLFQLKHTVRQTLLYQFYWYKSGMNKSMKNALNNIVNSAEKLVTLEPNDIVLDIGTNDGTLLKFYHQKDIIRVGFEPALNLIDEAKKNADLIINNYFNYTDFKKYFGPIRKAKIITSIAMFYDLDDPKTFTKDIINCLDINGIWIIQMSYLPSMLSANSFDNICHEHLSYYSLSALKNHLDKYNLTVVDVGLNNVNGGSFRIYIKHERNTSINPFPGANTRIMNIGKNEKNLKLNNKNQYTKFYQRIIKIKHDTLSFIIKNVAKGKKIYVYGASTKGNTFLQFCNLDKKLITAAIERNPLKWGKKTISTEIPIISENEARKAQPDYLLILPWYFREEFISREYDYLSKGGTMIFPLPQLEIVTMKQGKIISKFIPS